MPAPRLMQIFVILIVAAYEGKLAFTTSEKVDFADLDIRSINKGTVLRILPLGASITAGKDSSDGNGYRLPLQEMLQAHGNRVDFVGSQHYGGMMDNACEAYPGYTIEQVANATYNSGALDSKPNVILINVGTNNCAKKNEDPADAPQRFADLLAHIRAAVPNALVVVSSLLHNLKPSVNTCIKTLNPGLMRVALEARASGQKTVFADMYDAVPPEDIDQRDRTHPHDAGYAVMAEVWYQAIVRSAGNITPPASGVSRPAAASSPTVTGGVSLVRVSVWLALSSSLVFGVMFA